MMNTQAIHTKTGIAIIAVLIAAAAFLCALQPTTALAASADTPLTVQASSTTSAKATAPGKVTGLKVVGGNLKATISYNKTTGASGYEIAYKKKGASSWRYVRTTSRSKALSGLTQWSTYSVKVRAYKNTGITRKYGKWSATKTVSVTASIGKPSSVKVKGGAETITVSFKKGKYGTKSEVAYKKAGDSTWTVKSAGSKTTLTLSGLDGAQTYSVKVRSCTQFGGKTYNGKWSAVQEANVVIDSELIGTWTLDSVSNEKLNKYVPLMGLVGLAMKLDINDDATGKLTIGTYGYYALKWEKTGSASGVITIDPDGDSQPVDPESIKDSIKMPLVDTDSIIGSISSLPTEANGSDSATISIGADGKLILEYGSERAALKRA